MLEPGFGPGLSTLEPGLFLSVFLSELCLPGWGQRAWGPEVMEEEGEGLQCPVMPPCATGFCLGGTVFFGDRMEPQHKAPPCPAPSMSVTLHSFQGPSLAIACGVVSTVSIVQIGKLRTQ